MHHQKALVTSIIAAFFVASCEDAEDAQPFPSPSATAPSSQTSTNQIPIGVPLQATISAKDQRLGSWVDLSVNGNPPYRIDIGKMSDEEYALWGVKLGNLEVGEVLTIVFLPGKEGTLALGSIESGETKASSKGENRQEFDASPIERLERTAVLSAEEVYYAEGNFTISFMDGQGEKRSYAFPLERRKLFDEFRQKRSAGRKFILKWTEEEARVKELRFMTVDPVDKPALNPPVLRTAPSFPIGNSQVLWLTQQEAEDSERSQVTTRGDPTFARNLKTALSEVAKTPGAFVWKGSYRGSLSLLNSQPINEAQRLIARPDSRVEELLNIEGFNLETKEEEGSVLFMRILFKSASEVSFVFERQKLHDLALEGIVLRFANPVSKRQLDLHLLSPQLLAMQLKELPKTHLDLKGNLVTLKKGLFARKLQVVGSAGPRQIRLKANPNDIVFFGESLSAEDFTSRRMRKLPQLLVKPHPSDPLTCELSLLIDFMTELQQGFQDEISNLKEGGGDENASKMPVPEIYASLQGFGLRTGHSSVNYKQGSGKDSFGVHLVEIILNFFRKVHHYNPSSIDKLRKELTPHSTTLQAKDSGFLQLWITVCLKAEKEVFLPFANPRYDPKDLYGDLTSLMETLRFLKESERTFGVRDRRPGAGLVLSSTIKKIIHPGTGAIAKFKNLLKEKQTSPEGRLVVPQYNRAWNQFLQDFSSTQATAELTINELHKAVACMEDSALSLAFESRATQADRRTRLNQLEQWNMMLLREMKKKNPKSTPEAQKPEQKLQALKNFFLSSEWSLLVIEPEEGKAEAEWIRFK